MSELKCKDNYNWLLHLHYVRGEYNLFERQLNRLQVTSGYSWYLKGLIALRNCGNVKEALKCFERIAPLSSPQDVNHIKAIARCLLLFGQHNQVCQLIRDTGLQLHPSEWQLWYMLGICYLHTGNISAAKDAFQHGVQNSNQVEPFLMLAQCNVIEGDHKTAIFVLRKANEIVPDDLSVAVRLGRILMSYELRSKGIEKFLHLAQMKPNVRGNLNLSLAIGSIFQEFRGDIENALNKYLMSETFDSPSIWNNIGLCFSARKKYVAAVSCLKKALYLNPLDHVINYNLGVVHLHLKHFASAFHYLKASCSYFKPSSDVFSLLAICLQSLDDDTNCRQAHITAVKSSSLSASPLAIINYATYLYNRSSNANDVDQNKNVEMITELMIELEQLWLRKKQNDEEVDEAIMRSASKLCSLLNISHHMVWNRKDSTYGGMELAGGSRTTPPPSHTEANDQQQAASPQKKAAESPTNELGE